MKLFRAAVFATAIAATPSWVLAMAVNVTAVQVGSDVLMFGGGAIDTSAFGSVSSGTARAGMSPSVGGLNVGPVPSVSTEFYTDAIVTAPIFGSPSVAFASSGSGDILALFALGATNFVGLPSGYVSGSSLRFQSVYGGASFSSLGITPGSYEYALQGGQTVSFNTVMAPSVQIDVVESGGLVTMKGGGAINTSTFGSVSSGTARAGMSPSVGGLNVGPVPSVSTEFYTDAVVTAPIFGAPNVAFASSGVGDILALFAFGDTNFVGLPPDYDSGSPLSFESIYAGETLASLGLTSGLYGYLLASGEVITLNIHAPTVAVVPSPATLPLLATGLVVMGLAGTTGRRRPRRSGYDKRLFKFVAGKQPLEFRFP